MDPAYLRGAERLLAIAIAGMAFFLGYRLFIDVKTKYDSEGKFQLPGGTGIYLTRVGPGIFFALFGAVVIVVSFRSPIESTREGPAAPNKSFYQGFGSPAAASNSPLPPGTQQQLKLDLEFINKTFPNLGKTDLTEEQRTDLAVLIPKLKLGLMRMSWDEKWGDFTKFKDWVESGFSTPIPPELQEPAGYYRSKEEANK